MADALAAIPATAEIRPGDKINIIGAAGPMGTMHVIRDLCQVVPNVTVFAGDLSDERLAGLRKLSEPLAQKNKLTLKTYNPSKDKLAEKFGFAGHAATLIKTWIPDYKMPGISSAGIATAIAGALGTLVMFGLAWGVGRILVPSEMTQPKPDKQIP